MSERAKKANLLHGMRVLDLADEKASFCTKLLADMGASVVKIEPRGGDSSRAIGPFWNNTPHPERSLFFWYHNTNKLSITLNLKNRKGKEIFCKLLKTSDIVVETFPPDYLKGIGLGFEVLSKINPRLILVSVTGFGQSGPRLPLSLPLSAFSLPFERGGKAEAEYISISLCKRR
jgi:crotonobetainyl-CoA:carnitine CoA-transferase CaiB-like acyl-CoA transferase